MPPPSEKSGYGPSSMLGHSQHPIHLGGISMSSSVSTSVAVPNTNPFYVKAIEDPWFGWHSHAKS